MSLQLQPNSRHCFVCGLENPLGLKMRFFQAGPQRVVAYYTIPTDYQGYPGRAHGGVVAAMLDEVVGRCVMGTDPQHTRLFYTARLTLHYRRPVPVGQPLRLEGWAEKDRGRVLQARGAVFLEQGEAPLVEAEALLVAVPATEIQNMDMEALGWAIYPLEGDADPGGSA